MSQLNYYYQSELHEFSYARSDMHLYAGYKGNN